MTLRSERESRGLRLEDLAHDLNIPINDLCALEMASTKYFEILSRYIPGLIVMQTMMVGD